MGDAGAGQRSATLYTIIEPCRAHGLDPWAYLRDVLIRPPTMINRQVKDITPVAWAEARKPKQRAA
ncbi:MAG: transposase domain-containing protein [Verrucomicrobiota bacterium]